VESAPAILASAVVENIARQLQHTILLVLILVENIKDGVHGAKDDET